MRLRSAAKLHAEAAGTQTGGSSLIGRRYWVLDTRYGHVVSGPYDFPEEAEKAARARPYSKITSKPRPEQTQEVRDIARKRMVINNPDVD